MNAARTSSLSGDEDSTDDGSSDEEVYVDLRTLAAQSELPNDFWQVSLSTFLSTSIYDLVLINVCHFHHHHHHQVTVIQIIAF